MSNVKRYMMARIETPNDVFTLDLSSYMCLAGIESLNQIEEVRTSLYFPPAEYRNTGRTAEMPDDYQCLGSGSCVMQLRTGETRALSIALFHDTTRHHDAPEHVNAYIYGWPVKIVEPDWTKSLGDAHTLPVDVPLRIVIAPGTDRERHTTVRAPKGPRITLTPRLLHHSSVIRLLRQKMAQHLETSQ